MPTPTPAHSLFKTPEGKSFEAMSAAFAERLEQSWQLAWERLSAERQGDHWSGELSTSALSTATAISALCQMQKSGSLADCRLEVDDAISGGCQWLVEHQNVDGGFGDTDRSHSNIATSLLVIAAWTMTGFSSEVAIPMGRAWDYVERSGKWDGLRQRYGKDKTFVVPILSNCALAGLVSWHDVSPLPFETASLPQDWYRLARMPVVSYAIPALVAIGQARFHFAPPKNPLLRWLRSRTRQRTLEVLRTMQPDSGGYLEAVPLTSFVLMNLAATGNGHLAVSRNCLRFILQSRLADGSWPIDTNLATWVTSLSLAALSRRRGRLTVTSGDDWSANRLEGSKPNFLQTAGRSLPEMGSEAARSGAVPSDFLDQPAVPAKTVRWLLACQHTGRHPFTGANPGGWGWTDLSGAVPDADDTPAALISLSYLHIDEPELQRLRNQVLVAVGRGLNWLYRLQNRDGGWPTFCRGWGKLPFDRSGTDLTAHVLRAFQAWLPRWNELGKAGGGPLPSESQLRRAVRRGLRYLSRQQASDGSWLPLWFGNQDRPDEDNPVYGTGKVLLAYAALGLSGSPEARAGNDYLRANQNKDGGWGGGRSIAYCVNSENWGELDPNLRKVSENRSTIEETCVALEGLLLCGGDPARDAIIMRGLEWLANAIEQSHWCRPWPIGFYFAKLWYYERLYPTIFSLAALGAALHEMRRSSESPCQDSYRRGNVI